MLRYVARLDPLIFGLVIAVAIASVYPATGRGFTVVDAASKLAISLLFFLHGAKLSRDAVISGIVDWRLHGIVLIASYVMLPIFGVTLAHLFAGYVDPTLLTGLIFLAILPSTVQSSIAFTAIAGGRVPAAICAATLSNLSGVFLTPLLATLLINTQTGVTIAPGAGQVILIQVLMPFAIGQMFRPLIRRHIENQRRLIAIIDRLSMFGPLIRRHIENQRRLIAIIDRLSILLVVFAAFSEAVNHGLWKTLGAPDLAKIVMIAALFLMLAIGGTYTAGRFLRLPRESRIVLLFCGSKKSLMSGVPIAAALFPAKAIGSIILPVMIYHQLQIFLCAIIAAEYQRRGRENSEITRS